MKNLFSQSTKNPANGFFNFIHTPFFHHPHFCGHINPGTRGKFVKIHWAYQARQQPPSMNTARHPYLTSDRESARTYRSVHIYLSLIMREDRITAYNLPIIYHTQSWNFLTGMRTIHRVWPGKDNHIYLTITVGNPSIARLIFWLNRDSPPPSTPRTIPPDNWTMRKTCDGVYDIRHSTSCVDLAAIVSLLT